MSFSHFFSQLMQILLYVFTCLAFLSHLRRCKYHYYGMFILSVFVAKVLCLIKITFSVSHLTFHDCNSSIGMMPFPLCVTVVILPISFFIAIRPVSIPLLSQYLCHFCLLRLSKLYIFHIINSII